MVPLPTSDAALLGEHAFYDTGNLKHVIPFMKFHSYDLVLKRYNHSYAHSSGELSITSVLLMALCAFSLFAISIYISKWKPLRNHEKQEHMV